MTDDDLDELLLAVRAAEVERPSAFDQTPLEVRNGPAFDLPADVVVRPAVAVRTLEASDTTVQVYEWTDKTFFNACRLVTESDPPFVLFLYGGVIGPPSKRLVGGPCASTSTPPRNTHNSPTIQAAPLPSSCSGTDSTTSSATTDALDSCPFF